MKYDWILILLNDQYHLSWNYEKSWSVVVIYILWEQNFTWVHFEDYQFPPFDLTLLSTSPLLQETQVAGCHIQAFYQFTPSYLSLFLKAVSLIFDKWLFLLTHTIKWLLWVEAVKFYLCFKVKIRSLHIYEIFPPLFHSDGTTGAMALDTIAIVSEWC